LAALFAIAMAIRPMSEGNRFKIVCEICDAIGIAFDFPENAASSTPIKCRQCSVTSSSPLAGNRFTSTDRSRSQPSDHFLQNKSDIFREIANLKCIDDGLPKATLLAA
jgi:hypothetical protein